MKTVILTEKDFLAADGPLIDEPLSITMGVFDGLHRGHQALFKETLKLAKKDSLQSAVVAFDFAKVTLNKRKTPILTAAESAQALSAQGFTYYVIIQFGEHLVNMDPIEFLQQLTTVLRIVGITVGKDFSFGKNRTGDVETLKACSIHLRYVLHVVPFIEQAKTRISSSQIEQLLHAGDVGAANELLGYIYSMSGKVIHGEKRGRKLGYPTANMLVPAKKVSLPNGVYVTQVELGDKLYDAATNIGVSPTIKTQGQRLIETHIFDVSEDIYGKEITVYFHQRIRAEKKFGDIAALKQQMAKDIAISRRYLAKI